METLEIRRNNKEFTRWETGALPFNNTERGILRCHGFSPCGDGCNLYVATGDIKIGDSINDRSSMCHIAKTGRMRYDLYFSDDHSTIVSEQNHHNNDDLDTVLDCVVYDDYAGG